MVLDEFKVLSGFGISVDVGLVYGDWVCHVATQGCSSGGIRQQVASNRDVYRCLSLKEVKSNEIVAQD